MNNSINYSVVYRNYTVIFTNHMWFVKTQLSFIDNVSTKQTLLQQANNFSY